MSIETELGIMNIHLTELQKALLLHRLGVPDAIAEVLDCEYGLNAEVVEDAISKVEGMVSQCNLTISEMNKVDKHVLVDLIEGSTWFACNNNALSHGDITHQKDRAEKRSLESLVEKLEQSGFEQIDIPYC